MLYNICMNDEAKPTIQGFTASRLTSYVPLYVQIAEALTEQIEAGSLSPGTRLPSERDLSKQFGVNRMTLRQALDMLEHQGLLVRRQGDGTYVAQPRIERAAGQFFPFSKVMRRRGYTPSARIVMLERRAAEVVVAKQLHITVGASVYYSHRLRLLNHEPVMLEKFFLPLAVFPNLERFDLNTRSLYEVMETEYGITVSRAQQSLEPVAATAYEAELLGIKPDAPLMLERRLTFATTGQPVELSKDLYRGDRFRFVTNDAPLDWSAVAPQLDVREQPTP